MATDAIIQELKNAVKDYPDFPKEGIIFRDFLPILQTPTLFDGMITVFQEYLKHNVPDVEGIVGLESRGFLIGPPLALKLKLPFIPIRKPGKLPGLVKKESYLLEYGSDSLEIQCEAVKQNQKLVIVDDLLATGGTMSAAVKLIERIGGIAKHCLVIIELNDLRGREKILAPVYSLIQY